MKKHVINALIALGLASLLALIFLAINVSAYTSNSSVTANVNVGNVIYLSVSPNTISFNSMYPSTTFDTNVLVTDTDNGGNIAANVLVMGTNWYNGTANSILVGNTLWDSSAQTSYTGSALTNTMTDTKILILQPTLSTPSQQNNIYFGLSIPGGTPPGNYLQTISFENENTTYAMYNQPTTSNTVTAKVTVSGACYVSLSPSLINFGPVYASANVPTNVLVTDSDPEGDVAASLLVAGTNWALTSNSQVTFGVSNTLWNPSSLTTYSGNALTNTLSPTGITIAAPTQSSATTNSPIYFGLAVPGGTPAGTYQQTITIENSC
ncbi:MAG: hypothetical protein ACP5UH_02415 [Candidatus Micrarchaeia archaeon]